MSEFTVCRTADTYPALRYCLLLDGDRIAGGKPDYRGDNILIRWSTKETYGVVDALMKENAKLRELVLIAIKYCDACTCDGCPIQGEDESCPYSDMARELGVEVE